MPLCNKDTTNSLTIHLSEDVTVDSIIFSNQEDFSANLYEIRFQGINEYPPESENHWINLTSVYPNESDIDHLVDLSNNLET